MNNKEHFPQKTPEPVWYRHLNYIKTALLESKGDGKRVNQELKKEFEQYSPFGIAMIVGSLKTPDACVAFRQSYSQVCQEIGIVVSDVRDADIVLDTVCVNLKNWFLTNRELYSEGVQPPHQFSLQ
jgi:hypothetical protein